MTRFAPRLMVVLLCAAALAGCATTPDIAKATGGKTAADADSAQMADLTKAPADLESSVHQAQLLRTSGRYGEAIKILSQLMLVAADDPRVVSEYGKTLTEQGRASEAVQFLSRAVELQPNDWTIYSAQGVAYDQLGDQAAARTAYEHALALKPGEASVLNNYALSRMLADDPSAARQLIARAQAAGGASDPKIARNIALVNQLAPAPDAPPSGIAATVLKPVTMAFSHPLPVQQQTAAAPPVSVPRAPVTQQALAPLQASAPQPSGVVMERVPFDPQAGPVKPATHAPHPLTEPLAAAVKPDASKVAANAAPKPADAKPDAKPAPVKAADAKSDAKHAAPKLADVKPGAKPAATKTADAQFAPAKAASTKPGSAKADTDAVPALRLAADNKY